MMTKIKEHQNDLLSEEEKINAIKKEIYVELTKGFRKACLEFVELRHDHENRTELDDKEDLLKFAEQDHYTFQLRISELIGSRFKDWWQRRMYRGGWGK